MSVLAPLLLVAGVVWVAYKLSSGGSDVQTPSRTAPTAPPKHSHGKGGSRTSPWRPGSAGGRGRHDLCETPMERDFNLRVFTIFNPEDEVYTIDTRDTSGPFYGPVWTRIFTSLTQENELLRCRAVLRRRTAKNNAFAGYDVVIDGVRAFLPRSRCGYFRDERRDATGKCLAVKPFAFHPAGAKRGNLLVEAQTPADAIDRQPPGADGSLWALALDVTATSLVFSLPGKRIGVCPLGEAQVLAQRQNARADRPFLTGAYYRVLPLGKGRGTGGEWELAELETTGVLSSSGGGRRAVLPVRPVELFV